MGDYAAFHGQDCSDAVKFILHSVLVFIAIILRRAARTSEEFAQRNKGHASCSFVKRCLLSVSIRPLVPTWKREAFAWQRAPPVSLQANEPACVLEQVKKAVHPLKEENMAEKQSLQVGEGECLVLSPESPRFKDSYHQVRPRTADEVKTILGLSSAAAKVMQEQGVCCSPAATPAATVPAEDLDAQDDAGPGAGARPDVSSVQCLCAWRAPSRLGANEAHV